MIWWFVFIDTDRITVHAPGSHHLCQKRIDSNLFLHSHIQFKPSNTTVLMLMFQFRKLFLVHSCKYFPATTWVYCCANVVNHFVDNHYTIFLLIGMAYRMLNHYQWIGKTCQWFPRHLSLLRPKYQWNRYILTLFTLRAPW